MADRNWTGLSGQGAAQATGSGAGLVLAPGGALVLLASGEDGRAAIYDAVAGRVKCDLPALGAGGGKGRATGGKRRGGKDAGAAGHLALRLSAATWAPTAAAEKGGSRRRGAAAAKTAAAALPSLVALGTHDGDVLAWDLAAENESDALWRAAGAHEGAVRSLVAAAGGDVVFSGGDDGAVCQLDVRGRSVLRTLRAAQRPVTALALSADGCALLSAASRATLWRAEGGAAEAPSKALRLAGHATAVSEAAFSPDGAWALTASAAEREVALWDARAGAEEGAPAALLLPCDASVVSLSVAPCGGSNKGAFAVLALSATGSAHVWRVAPAPRPRSRKAADAAATVALLVAGAACVAHVAPPPGKAQRSAADALWALAPGAFSSASSGSGLSVCVAHGSHARPTVAALDFSAAELKDGVSRELDAVQGGALAASSAGGAGGASGAAAVKAAPPAAAQVLDAEMVAAGGSKGRADKRKRRAAAANGGAGSAEGDEDAEMDGTGVAAAAAHAEEAAASAGGELTLGERVARLALAGERERAGGAGGAAADGAAGVAGAGAAPSAGSMGVLLAQALESCDDALLERCFAVANERQVSATVARLPPSMAAALVAAAASRLRAKPTRAPALCVWLRATLAAHAATLMASPSAQSALRELYAAVDARTALLSPLLQLQGRLSLLAAQAGMGDAAGAPLARAEALDAPMATFVDSGDVEAVDLLGADEDEDGEESFDDDESEVESDDDDGLGEGNAESAEEDEDDYEDDDAAAFD